MVTVKVTDWNGRRSYYEFPNEDDAYYEMQRQKRQQQGCGMQVYRESSTSVELRDGNDTYLVEIEY